VAEVVISVGEVKHNGALLPLDEGSICLVDIVSHESFDLVHPVAMVSFYFNQPVPLILAFKVRVEPVLVALFGRKPQTLHGLTKPSVNIPFRMRTHYEYLVLFITGENI
jgi:hypothetical protein